jgi:hypothetical protein
LPGRLTRGQLAIGILTDAFADGVLLDFVCGDEVYGWYTILPWRSGSWSASRREPLTPTVLSPAATPLNVCTAVQACGAVTAAGTEYSSRTSLYSACLTVSS